MKRWIFLLTLGVAGGLLMRQFFFEGVYVASPSMEPALPVGMHYFLDKVSFMFRQPKRREIVVFPSPVNKEKDLIKRVIGLPGETIVIVNKKVSINGKPLQEPYAVFKRADEILVGDNLGPMEVPRNSYFVMGDNRDESGDSRDWKDPSGNYIYFVKMNDIKGRILDPVPESQ